jgi:ribosome-associated protein
MLALQELGDQLVDTPDRILDSVPISESLREAVLEARKLKRGARRRQRQHIGSLMREEDVDGIRRSLQEAFQPHKEEVRSFHQVEVWRDALIAGDDDLMSELLGRFPIADRQQLRQLARNAAKERAKNQAPKSARALFQYLAELESGT